MNPSEVLTTLKAGNKQFINGQLNIHTLSEHPKKDELAVKQEPIAIILGCSDSRVPAEVVFNQGLGDLFVVRVAGNIVTPSLMGSVEFAAVKFNVPLVVVLGHSSCGAIAATIETMKQGVDAPSDGINAIVERIRPTVEPFQKTALWDQTDELMDASVRANVVASCTQIRQDSEILRQLISDGKLAVVGAEYSLTTGKVDFFEGDLD